MKKTLLLLFLASTAYCVPPYTYTGTVSTASLTLVNSSARIDNVEVINSSNTVQTVYLYDGSNTTSNWAITCPANSATFRNFSNFIAFVSSVNVKCQDLFNNKKVTIYINCK